MTRSPTVASRTYLSLLPLPTYVSHDPHANPSRVAGQVRQRKILDFDDGKRFFGGPRLDGPSSGDVRSGLDSTLPGDSAKHLVHLSADLRDSGANGVGHGVMLDLHDF